MDEQLLQYGVFGLWTLFNIYLIKWFMQKQDEREDKLSTVVENNTIAMNSFKERQEYCINLKSKA